MNKRLIRSTLFASLAVAFALAIAPGVTLHFSSRALAGFPFRVDAVLENMRIDVATPHGPATWKAEHFALHMLDYGRLQFVFEAAGKQTISWHDEKGAAHGLSFTPALLRASANAGGGTLSRFDIELYGAATQAVAVTHSELHIRHDPDADRQQRPRSGGSGRHQVEGHAHRRRRRDLCTQ